MGNLFEISQKFVEESLRTFGNVNSFCYLHRNINGERQVIPYEFKGPNEDLQKKKIIQLIKDSIKNNTFEALVMIAQTWMSRNLKYRPAQDPQKQEIIVILVWELKNNKINKETGIFELIRLGDLSNGLPMLGENIIKECNEIETWLDDAFKNCRISQK